MLRLIRRHVKACPHTSSRYRRCSCPIHVYGTLAGERIRRALDLTSWEAASDLIRGWEASGQIGVVKPEVPTVNEAISTFLHDLEHGQKRSAATLSKHKNLLEKRLLPWCEEKGYRVLKQLDVTAVREFRWGWSDGPVTAGHKVLLTSRFRRGDRSRHEQRLLNFDADRKSRTLPENDPGLICVSTQVIEAGVDISAHRLWSELAAWPSMLQRLGP